MLELLAEAGCPVVLMHMLGAPADMQVEPSYEDVVGEITAFLAEEISPHTYVNIMDQYRPCGRAHRDEFINRRLSAREFRAATYAAKKAGLTRLDPRERTRLLFTI